MPRSVVISVLKLPHGAAKYATPHHGAQKESEFGTKPSKEEGGGRGGRVAVCIRSPVAKAPVARWRFHFKFKCCLHKKRDETRRDEDATRRPCTVAHCAAVHRGAKNDD